MRRLITTIALTIVVALPTVFLSAPSTSADPLSKAGQRVSKEMFLKHFIGVIWIGTSAYGQYDGTGYVGTFKRDGTFEIENDIPTFPSQLVNFDHSIQTGTWKIDDSGIYCQEFDSGWAGSCWFLEYSDTPPGFKILSATNGHKRSYIEKSINGDSYFERLVLAKLKASVRKADRGPEPSPEEQAAASPTRRPDTSFGKKFVTVVPSPDAPNKDQGAPDRQNTTVQNRLEIVKNLETKGLITSEEAREKRQEIVRKNVNPRNQFPEFYPCCVVVMRELTLDAKRGDAVAQRKLGSRYANGSGVKQNFQTAVKWYAESAEQGDIKAQFALGQIYADGNQGVPKNYKASLQWYSRAAEQGNLNAQFILGQAYAQGNSVVPKNYKTALKWYRLAAKQGDEYGQAEVKRLEKKIASKKASPTITASKTPSGISETETQKLKREVVRLKRQEKERTERLRQENARLKRQEQEKRAALQQEIARLKEEKRQASLRKREKRQPLPKSVTSGSGFFVSRLGHIVTNEHVIRKCRSVTVGDNADKQVAASVLEADRRNDLALLRISSTRTASAETRSLISKLGVKKLGIRVVPLASGGLMRSEDIELGERVLVAGFPYGELYSDTIKVTGGMVSAVRGMGDDSAQFQIDAAVQPGNSGGPIYDENGNIVGVVVAQLNKLKVAKVIGSLPENVNFGIKASTVRQFLTSAGLPTKWSNRTEQKTTRELAKIAKNQTVMVQCHQ
jgi:S1-C subfamily serine protease